MNNKYDHNSKCIQWTMNMKANVWKEQRPQQQRYSMNNDHNSECIQWTMNITAYVLQEQWLWQQMNFKKQWPWQEMYSMIMAGNVFNEQ